MPENNLAGEIAEALVFVGTHDLRGKYTEKIAREILQRNNVEIKEEKKEIFVKGVPVILTFRKIVMQKNQIGIKLWGVVDFLTKNYHYSIEYL